MLMGWFYLCLPKLFFNIPLFLISIFVCICICMRIAYIGKISDFL